MIPVENLKIILKIILYNPAGALGYPAAGSKVEALGISCSAHVATVSIDMAEDPDVPTNGTYSARASIRI